MGIELLPVASFPRNMLSSKMPSLSFGLTALLLLTSISQCTVAQNLPQVDLGYEIHQAIAFNV